MYKVTNEQVLESAGLDAYVVWKTLMVTRKGFSCTDDMQFLAFFKMSMKLFSVMFLFAAVALAPLNKHFVPEHKPEAESADFFSMLLSGQKVLRRSVPSSMLEKGEERSLDYLWAYWVFTYVFTGIVVYFVIRETQSIIRIRQDYLGSQSTVTDRTIRLSGIPKDLRTEMKIEEFIEKLEIGKVDTVTLCKDWEKLDDLMDERDATLRRLEEAWAVHIGRRKSGKHQIAPSVNNHIQQEEEDAEVRESGNLLGQSHVTPYEKPRPTTRIWYGFWNLQSKKVDAIDYLQEKLRKLDEKILEARKKDYEATPIAFVTMDSIPACQMAVQALLSPSPMQLLAQLAPAPTDIVWRNTYTPRFGRMFRQWTITIFIVVLTIVWFIPVIPLAGLLDLCSIQQVWPQAAKFLSYHPVIKSLVQTGLPTLVVSLLNLSVPFLYDLLSNYQGMISQGDVDLSTISKNFLFTFFNVFLVFTAFGAASKFWPVLQDSLKDNTKIARQLAQSVQDLTQFYTNFILLQSIGLQPFRLLEFGSVALYPVYRFGAKTPRDFAELVQPPKFSYGFYLPTALLIFILCLVYSILPDGWIILLFGLVYFVLGYYTYKYQLLYAMDNPQHSTGRAWSMICYRIIIGLITFQLVMAGLLALNKYIVAATLVIPLLVLTVWFSYYFGRTYEPLMKYIALKSIQRDGTSNSIPEDTIVDRPTRPRRESRTLDEDREKDLIFINPSLVVA